MRFRRQPARKARLIAVGGGKGGVGKTFLSANLAALLARDGSRVVAIDTDLEGANLHTWLGVASPTRTLADFVSGREGDPAKLAIETPYPNLQLIAATQAHLVDAQPDVERRAELIRQARQLDCDVVILDCGAGTHAANVDYFVSADDGILVLHPEPTSLENAYNFLRSVVLRRMELSMLKPDVQECVREAMDQRNDRGIRTPADLLEAVRELDAQEVPRFREALAGLRPRIVVNEVLSAEDVKLGFSVRSVCRSFFGVETEYIGYVNSDDRVRPALRARVPVVVSDPECDASIYLERIARKLAPKPGGEA